MTMIGVQTYVEQPISTEFDWQRGWQSIRRYLGDYTSLETLEATMRAAGWNTVLKQGPVAELQCAISVQVDNGGDPIVEVPQDVWEFSANVIEKDILESDCALLGLLRETEIGFLRKVLSGKVDEQNYTDDTNYPAAPITTGFVDMVKMAIAGVRSKMIFQPVVKKSQVVSTQYQIPNSFSHVGDVISTSYFVATQSLPTAIGTIISTLNESGDKTRGDGIEVYKGWLVNHPTLTTAANGRLQLAQEWHWGEYARLLYTIQE